MDVERMRRPGLCRGLDLRWDGRSFMETQPGREERCRVARRIPSPFGVTSPRQIFASEPLKLCFPLMHYVRMRILSIIRRNGYFPLRFQFRPITGTSVEAPPDPQ